MKVGSIKPVAASLRHDEPVACILTVALSVALGMPACTSPDEVYVLAASSLAYPLGEIGRAYSRANPDVRLRFEVGSNQSLTRRITELRGRADLLAVDDAFWAERFLVPSVASSVTRIAANQIVLVHRDHSRYTSEITSENWFEILGRPEVRLGIVDPDTSPLGYRTQMVWHLAERFHAADPTASDLSERLQRQVAAGHQLADENDVLGLLAARAIDYTFTYLSVAQQHGLKITRLRPEYNLGQIDRAGAYAQFSLTVHDGADPAGTLLPATPILWGVAVPRAAVNPKGATRFATAITAPSGQRLLQRWGLIPWPTASRVTVTEPTSNTTLDNEDSQ